MKSHDVVLRAKVRAHRRKQAAALAGLAALGGLAFVTVNHLRSSKDAAQPRPAANPRPEPPFALEPESSAPRPPVPAPSSRSDEGWRARLFRIEKLQVIGVPEPIERQIREAAGLKAGDVALPWARGRIEERLKFLFPFLKSVRVSREWWSRTLTLALELKGPVAKVEVGGEDAGFLSDEGARFKAPSDLFVEPLPAVELGEAPDGDLSALAQFFGFAARDGALPSPVATGSWKGAEGWSFRLQDGTRLTWGGLSWTEEKLARLREALVGAKLKFKGGVAADLRYFEDGRILVKEIGEAMPKAAPGGPKRGRAGEVTGHAQG